MKKTTTLLYLALASLFLTACVVKPANKSENQVTKKSSSDTKESSTTESSSNEMITSNSSANLDPEDDGLYESQEDVDKVLRHIKDADQLPEWQNFKQIQIGSGLSLTITDEAGTTSEQALGDQNVTPSTYQDVVNLLGEPAMSLDESGGITFWQKDSTTIMIFFSGETALHKTFQGLPNAKTISDNAVKSVSAGETAEEVFKRLGQPQSVMQTDTSTSLVWLDESGRSNSVLFADGIVHSTISGEESEQSTSQITGDSSAE